jgi:hypothetical protein
MNGTLRNPALQGAAGVGAFVALSWPLLVFDRPIYVLVSFFLIWPATIALLFLFSRAPDDVEPTPIESNAGAGDATADMGARDGAHDGGSVAGSR